MLVLAAGGVPAAHAVAPSADDVAEASRLAYRRAMQATNAASVTDPAIGPRLRRALARLTAVAPVLSPQTSGLEWSLAVEPSDALALRLYPHGQMLASAGLVTRSGFADDELAAILAQYAAHALLGHPAASLDLPADVAAAPDPNRRVLALGPRIEQVAAAPRFAPEQILDADALGVRMMARAMIDPRAAASAWRRIARESTGIATSQPVTPDRLAALDAEIQQAMPVYEEQRAERARRVQAEREKARERAARRGTASRSAPKPPAGATAPATVKPEPEPELPFDPDAESENAPAPR